jgi:iron complex transport system substrate-binding protein
MLLFALCGLGLSPRAAGCRTITDMDDRKIEVPGIPKRIACMHGVSSDRIIMLGKGNCLVSPTGRKPLAFRRRL